MITLPDLSKLEIPGFQSAPTQDLPQEKPSQPKEVTKRLPKVVNDSLNYKNGNGLSSEQNCPWTIGEFGDSR